mmetsp:Transcript_26245/g.37474  ORF Transcript_26245/g.37474 Transcript_26245/m.37474 type:complete len:429 (+) Transcript_26245:94-1380(+)
MVEVATTSANWIELGDRSHPNLKLIDKLKSELTYDGHKTDLKELEQAHFKGGSYFKSALDRVKGLEKMSRGDRSHPNLVRLDKLRRRTKLTYDGWRADFEEAEKAHQNVFMFDIMFNKIKRKQKLSVGDRSDEDVKFLDSMRRRLSYPGWEKDWQRRLDSYIRGHDLTDQDKFSMLEKQRMYEGDRSHPRLVALDALRLTYPGWEKDVKSYEYRHVGSFNFSILDNSAELLAIFKRKQQGHVRGKGDRSWMQPVQRTIVETKWTFPGWKLEVQVVSVSTCDFSRVLEDFQIKQMIHDEDYSRHPKLNKLKSLQLSYPDCEQDIEKCERQLTSSLGRGIFDETLEAMLAKQHVYDGYLRSMIRDTNEEKEVKTSMGECIVCWAVPRTHVFVPCGHMSACKSCSTRVMRERKVCPTCNQPSTMAIEVFLP